MAVRFLPVQIILSLCLTAAHLVRSECETESYEAGVCIPLHRCDAFNYTTTGELSTGQWNLLQLERSKCPIDGTVCCKRKVHRREIPRSFEDVKPLEEADYRRLPDRCGEDSSDRIFNGNVTNLGQFPWLVLIKNVYEDETERFRCGGSLISSRYVLTAAHCIERDIAEVRLGEWDLESNPDCIGVDQCADPAFDVGIEKIVIHKGYKRKAREGVSIDMALVRLDREVTMGKYVQAICLPRTESQAKIVDGQEFLVAGWGMTENYVESTKKLFVAMYNVNRTECKRLINSPLLKIDDTTICAVGKDGQDCCQGDSGGPLMDIKEVDGGAKRYFLSGIVSKGLGCGSTKPGFYTHVQKQLDWIVSNMEA